MDGQAYFGGETTTDRANRARPALQLYTDAHPETELSDLIADLLHLADVDEYPDGGEAVALAAMSAYQGEQPTWPTGHSEFAGAYLAQARAGDKGWLTLAGDDDPRAAAEYMRRAMQIVGFRTSEMAGHVDDLVAGHVLTSDDGHVFRVVKREN
ncbi:hypothetical protein ACFYWP_37125 [Actinacidiphila glaucinigra]|uniref:hypothetical protein n=1 Tax=Actinacidiphila glaucinigra TaxID=235986 RepID=UPI0036BE2616